jgi:SulP family sulfate permease
MTSMATRSELQHEAAAGLPGAVASVPDGMAAAVLAGVNPVHGLYASFAGPIGGGLTASTRLMVITTTSAAALAAGSAVSGFDQDQRPAALIGVTLLAGAAMAAAGLVGLGRYTRFVSFSVMTGFLTGVAANIVFGQIPDLTGVDASGGSAVAKALYVVTHPAQIDLAALATGAAAILLLVLVARTRWASFAAIVALVVPSLATLGVGSLVRVEDTGDIPRGVPLPHLPELGIMLHPDVLVGALSVAVIVLVQGVGVSEAAGNLDGTPSDPNRDFLAQGVGNLASGAFGGQPVGGSVGQTALNVAAGARTRWASVFSGLWMFVILIAFSGVIGRVPMPILAAILVVAAVGSLRSDAIATIWRTGVASQIAIVTTFVATLFLPVAAAVGLGVALSLLLQLNSEAVDLRVVQLEPAGGGRFRESPAPAVPADDDVTVLDVYGSLYYAGAKTLAVRLPDPTHARRPVVVLRLRGRTRLGATSLVVIDTYAAHLAERQGRLVLAGVDPELLEQIGRAHGPEERDRLDVLPATDLVGESLDEAIEHAHRWLYEQPEDA